MALECRQCGQANPDGAEFCSAPSCGAYLRWDGPAGQPVRQPTTAVPVVSPGDRAGASLVLADRHAAVEPGETTAVTLSVHNGGTRVEQFTLAVLGPAAAWATVEPPTLSVYPGDRAEATVRFAPPRGSASPAGRASFRVQAASTVHPGLVATADGTLDVGVYRELGAVLVPQNTSGRGRTRHRLELTNTGNVVEPVRITASDPDGRLRFGVPAGDVAVPPGGTAVPLTVTAPWRFVGAPRPHRFTVQITPRPPAPPVRLDGGREAVALFTRSVPILVGVLVLLAGIGFGAAKVAPLLTSQPSGPTPTPVATAASPVPSVSPPSPSSTPSPSASRSPSPSPSPSATAGPADACKPAYVWREAFPSDHVCVLPATHSQALADNGAASSRWTNGAYGSRTCVAGYVWREATPTDTVCVTPATRTLTGQDNAQATARSQTPPKNCRSGYVWREAFSTDYVCVTSAVRTQAGQDNAQAGARREPNGGPSGADTCKAGYVWRGARDADHVCVLPAVRSQTAADNAAGASRTVP
ncbi:zinc ribbon domain-containing protein [Longispora sp. NPDC051575]|uniref:zinc ribbon domain-containing protein n=1 Tax=Longispora sp. NPDC051575 TaxID=3154943 RepID=UPI003446DA8B